MMSRLRHQTEWYACRYGDMVFKEFTSAVLDSAQLWFDANMIILSCRPSIALNTKHAIAM